MIKHDLQAIGPEPARTELRSEEEINKEIIYYIRVWSGSHRQPDLNKVQQLCEERFRK